MSPTDEALLGYATSRGWLTADQVSEVEAWLRQLSQAGTPTPVGALLGQRYLTPPQLSELKAHWASLSGSGERPALPQGTHAPPPGSAGPLPPTAAAGSRASSTTSSRGRFDILGQTIGNYQVERELARGGMGVVYVARDLRLDREVAFKVMLADQAGEVLLERFRREAQGTAKLNHPNIVRVHHFGDVQGRPYYVMDLVSGESLRKRIDREGPLDEREAARVAEQLARALQHAHESGVLHRDMKPDNVLLAEGDGRPLITDFGLARDSAEQQRLTKTGEMLGTPGYMPPEQADGDVEAMGPHSDTYSVGATLYAMLTGQAPFAGDTPIQVIKQVLTEDPVPPHERLRGLDPNLSTVCMKALEREPGDRYASLDAMAEDLARWQRGEPIVARPPSRAERWRRWRRRNPIKLALSVTLPTVGLVGLTVGVRSAIHTQRAEQERQQRQQRRQNESARTEQLGQARRRVEGRVARLRSRLEVMLNKLATARRPALTPTDPGWRESDPLGFAKRRTSEIARSRQEVEALRAQLEELRDGARAPVARDLAAFDELEELWADLERALIDGVGLAVLVQGELEYAQGMVVHDNRQTELFASNWRSQRVAHWERGRALAEDARKLRPDDPETCRLVGLVMRRLGLASRGQEKIDYYAVAEPALTRWVEARPDDPRAYHFRGKLRREWLDELSEGEQELRDTLADGALADLRRWTELEPKEPEAYTQLGKLLRRAGRHAEAVQAFSHILETMVTRENIDLTLQTLESRGDSLRRAGRWEEALEDFSELDGLASVAGKVIPEATFGRARIHLDMGDWDAAGRDIVALFEYARRERNKRYDPRWVGARVRWILGSVEGDPPQEKLAVARREAQRWSAMLVRDLDGQSSTGSRRHRAMARLRRAQVLRWLGKLQKAERNAERALDFEESDEAYRELALARLERGDRTGALEMLAAGLKRFPESPWLWLARGDHLAADPGEARTAYQQVVEIGPPEAHWVARAREGLRRLGE